MRQNAIIFIKCQSVGKTSQRRRCRRRMRRATPADACVALDAGATKKCWWRHKIIWNAFESCLISSPHFVYIRGYNNHHNKIQSIHDSGTRPPWHRPNGSYSAACFNLRYWFRYSPHWIPVFLICPLLSARHNRGDRYFPKYSFTSVRPNPVLKVGRRTTRRMRRRTFYLFEMRRDASQDTKWVQNALIKIVGDISHLMKIVAFWRI